MRKKRSKQKVAGNNRKWRRGSKRHRFVDSEEDSKVKRLGEGRTRIEAERKERCRRKEGRRRH